MRKLVFAFLIAVFLLFVAGCVNPVHSYICKIDDCRQVVLGLINGAHDSVYFMTYSLTDDEVGGALVTAAGRGVLVRGVMEKQQKSQYSEFDKLKNYGIDVVWDSNSALMHHKVFVIDEKIVITGSCNPTENGFGDNDENIVVIHSAEDAKLFLEEFHRLRS